MKRDGDMHMRGGRIKERSRGTQQKKREEKNRRAGIEKEWHWGEKSHFMKMRFSTERDYNDHQRETVAEREHAACARFHMHIYRLWPTFSRIRLLQSFYELFCLLFLRNLCTFMLLMWRCVCACAAHAHVHTRACGVLISSTCAWWSAFIWSAG